MADTDGYYRDSVGTYYCKSCKKGFVVQADVVACAMSHVQERVAAEKVVLDGELAGYKEDMLKSPIDVGKRLCLRLVEDYETSRKKDLESRGTVGPVTMGLGRSAADAVFALSKVVVGDRSTAVQLNLDARRSDVDALKELVGDLHNEPESTGKRHREKKVEEVKEDAGQETG